MLGSVDLTICKSIRLSIVSYVMLCVSSLTSDSFAEAMDRIHRLGQHRPVQVVKLVTEDSIESRIIQVKHLSLF